MRLEDIEIKFLKEFLMKFEDIKENTLYAVTPSSLIIISKKDENTVFYTSYSYSAESRTIIVKDDSMPLKLFKDNMSPHINTIENIKKFYDNFDKIWFKFIFQFKIDVRSQKRYRKIA
jgi:hypothetical protein